MKAQLVIVKTAASKAALFVNQVVVMESYSDEMLTLLENTGRKLAQAMGVQLLECAAPQLAGAESWSDVYNQLQETLPIQAKVRSSAELLVYMWSEGYQEQDTEEGPGDWVDELCFDTNPPTAGTPYMVLAPIHMVNTHPTETSVMVKHWNAYGCEFATENTHQFDIDDQRRTNGQAYVTVGGLDGMLDDLLSVTMEVSTNPLNGVDHVPVAHVHFDGDNLAVSLFKVGDRILLRPETDVKVEATAEKAVDSLDQRFFWIQ